MADRDYNLPPTIVNDIIQLKKKITCLEAEIDVLRKSAHDWKDKYYNIKSEYDAHFLVWLEMKRQAQNERSDDNNEANSETL